jgi:hypothetical protein
MPPELLLQISAVERGRGTGALVCLVEGQAGATVHRANHLIREQRVDTRTNTGCRAGGSYRPRLAREFNLCVVFCARLAE